MTRMFAMMLCGVVGLGLAACGTTLPTSTNSDSGSGSSSGDSTTDSSDDSDSTSTTSTKCSSDGSESLVPGTYTFTLNTGKTQVKIFKSDCNKCFKTMDDDETKLDVDGTWTSANGTKDSDGQQIAVTVGTLTYTISGDGQTLTQSSSSWFKKSATSYTCGGDKVL